MTDNRPNEPTESQVEAAAKVLLRDYQSEYDGGDVSEFLEVARAALEAAARAAQCAAPHAGSSPTSSYINPSLPGMIRNLWKSDPSENSVRTALKLAGDLIQELIDMKAAPVLPSGGVDEDDLARLLCEKNYLSPDGKPTCSACRYKAHEVAEWLKGEGR